MRARPATIFAVVAVLAAGCSAFEIDAPKPVPIAPTEKIDSAAPAPEALEKFKGSKAPTDYIIVEAAMEGDRDKPWIALHVRPATADGAIIKAPGRFTFRLFREDTRKPRYEGGLVGSWSIGGEDALKLWYGGFWTEGYVLRLNLEDLGVENQRRYILVTTFTPLYSPALSQTSYLKAGLAPQE